MVGHNEIKYERGRSSRGYIVEDRCFYPIGGGKRVYTILCDWQIVIMTEEVG
jgi:hypothetical protein